ncbi:MAG: peptide deformylase [Dysgonamonadaceae bacterium]|nr:peptide deformylase [Dysgonamonadaceae bacterium]MDD4727320.1 peptide deformylase [Dysgonamonadaceae bacterium]
MILPIYIYGHPVLRKVTTDINSSYPNLKELIDNMFETMYNAEGVGLAAPQVGLEDRIFVIDLSPLADEDHPEFKDLKKAFVNARITKRTGEMSSYEEGCLSIPGINENVPRQDEIEIEYLDEYLEPHTETYTGFTARVIQHEYDHIEGILFIDHISAIRKRLIKSKLANMTKGKVNCHYRVRTA